MTQTNLKNNPNNSSLLKDTRITKGLTLEIVHEATKIPMDALRAIEEGYSTRILTPFYYRGFVKIYAEFLGLKVTDVLKEYNVQPAEVKTIVKTSVRPIAKTYPKTPTKQTPKAPVNKGPNPFLEQVQEFWRVFWTPKTRKNLLRVLAAVVALIILVKIGGCVVGGIKSMFKNHPKTAVVVKTTKKQVKKAQPKEEVRAQEEESVVREAPPKVIAAESQNHKVTLTAHAPRDTSIQVKTDGKIVFQMTMKKGTVENWEANDQIELSGKNIGQLDLEVNGKDVSSLGSNSRRARRVVITKDGLTVKK